jgi:hypothetical protein
MMLTLWVDAKSRLSAVSVVDFFEKVVFLEYHKCGRWRGALVKIDIKFGLWASHVLRLDSENC